MPEWVCDSSLYICRFVIGSPWRILMCFFMCAVLNQSSLVSADNSVLLRLISIYQHTEAVRISVLVCLDNVLCMFPCRQGPSCCHKETLHQRPDCVRPVAPVCVGMERICRCRGELRSCSSISGWTFCATLYHSFCFHLCVRMARLCWFSWESGLKASFLPLYFLCSSPW